MCFCSIFCSACTTTEVAVVQRQDIVLVSLDTSVAQAETKEIHIPDTLKEKEWITLVEEVQIEVIEVIETSESEQIIEEIIQEQVEEYIEPEPIIEQEPVEYIEELAPATNMTYAGDWTITFYCDCAECVGQYAGMNMTASGNAPIPWYSVAAGSSYPFGTRLYIEGFGEFVVYDRGVPDGWADIYVSSHAEIPSYGMTTAAVYILN